MDEGNQQKAGGAFDSKCEEQNLEASPSTSSSFLSVFGMLRYMGLLFDNLFPTSAFLEWYIQLISSPRLSRLSSCSHFQNVAFDVHPVTVGTGLTALYERISLPCCPENNGARWGCFILPSLFSVETSDADLRPILLDQQRNIPSTEVCISIDSSVQHSTLGETPFMHVAGRSSAQNRRRLVL